MHNFKNRKFLLLLLLAALVFFCRVLLPGAGIAGSAMLAAALSLAFFALGGGFAKRRANVFFAAFLLAFSAFSLFYGTKVLEKRESALALAAGEAVFAEAEVTEVRFTSAYASSYLVKLCEANGEKADFGALLEIERGTSFKKGDIIKFNAVFSENGEEKAYLRAKNVFVCAAAEDAVRTGRAEENIISKLWEANEYMCSRFVKLMGRRAGGFCSALILGNKSYVDTGLKLDFSRSGISHLLALSGLHLSVLSGALDFILRGFAGKKARGALLIASLFFFAVFTGLSASVLRAAVMLAFVFAAEIFGEENDSVTALFAAVWVILIVNGNAVYDIGFLLSVAATLGIILTRPAFDGLFETWQAERKSAVLRLLRAAAKYFYGIFTMSLSAFFFTLPVMGFAFGEVSWVGVLSNFVFLPLAAVLIVLCALLIPLSYVPVLSSATAAVCKWLSEIVIFLAERVSELRGVSVSLRYPFVPYLLLMLGVLIFACIFIKRLSLLKLSAGALAFLLSFAACFGIYSRFTAGNVPVCIGSGKSGEYVAFKADGENYFVDISTGGYSFVYETLENREYFCDTEIDNFVLTHYHNHHAGALERLCEAVKIRRVFLPMPETEAEEEDFAYMAETLEKKGVRFELYSRGTVLANGNVSINFAPARKISRSEKPLVAFTVLCGGASFSYIEGAALESAFDYGEYLSAQTVFVGAHGPSRKFGVYASVFEKAGRVIFASGASELFSGTEYLAEAYEITDYGGKMTILYE